MAKEKLIDEKTFIGKTVEVHCTDREETHWGPCELNSLSPLGATLVYDSRGVTTSIFVPAHIIGYISMKVSQVTQVSEAKTV